MPSALFALLHDEQEVTVSCAEGEEGFVYEGHAEVESEELKLDDVPQTRTKVMLNLANPAAAFRWWRLPADGVERAGVGVERGLFRVRRDLV